jgi:hypothetical protein
MALSFGVTFASEYAKFANLKNIKDFQSSIIPFVQFMDQILSTDSHPLKAELENWQVTLFNEDRHILYPHQIIAIRGCIDNIVLSDEKETGYCFMPTSAGKGHILMTLAGMAVGDFSIIKIAAETMPDIWKLQPKIMPVLISLSLDYAKLIEEQTPRTQILVHDTAILSQLKEDCEALLGKRLASRVEFHSVQALRNEKRRLKLKYVIIDECHWGNATEEETIQSELIKLVSETGGKAFGFTASPYPGGKFQKTWSGNKVSGDLNFNYYLDNKILYPVTLREVNLQNARVGFNEGDEEVDLTEKKQITDFISQFISTSVSNPLDGPAMCYFNSTIIPDIVESLINSRPDLKSRIKVLASDSAMFSKKCAEQFGAEILATDDDIRRMKAGENLFVISRQKLLVGLNAPYLRYCFISPTNSKIIIMQGIGRLMRPIDAHKVPKKLAVLFLTSLSGKKLDITAKGSNENDGEDADEEYKLPEEHDDPKNRYTTTSMTLSEAYDLPIPVFYKVEVGFKDFINQSRIKDGNSVEIIRRGNVDTQELEETDWLKMRQEVNSTRAMVLAQYKREIIDRDSKIEDGKKVWFCHGKDLLGDNGCEMNMNQVNLEIHHKPPFTFAELYRKLGKDGVLAWHSDRHNMKYLITLCENCHDKVHSQADDSDVVA